MEHNLISRRGGGGKVTFSSLLVQRLFITVVGQKFSKLLAALLFSLLILELVEISTAGSWEVDGSRASHFSGGFTDFDRIGEHRDRIQMDENSVEIVIGIDNSGVSHVKKLVEGFGGKIVNKVSSRKETKALVADIPLKRVSMFAEKAQGLAKYVEPNFKVELAVLPNDPGWTQQWGPAKIEADYAWNTTMGNSTLLVAVIDTGIDYNHPELAANYVPLGYDWAYNDADPFDDHGHGTHCAGIIAASINNSIGIAGLAQVQIMAEKVFDSGGHATDDDLANGIIHAVDQGARILSNSWGGSDDSMIIHQAIQYAYNAGALVLAAAGNDSSRARFFPASYDEVVSVAATDINDTLAGFSNFGFWLEVAAPGVDIYSTIPNSGYDSWSGTSMACPHAAGTAALIWSRFPDMTRDWVALQLQYTADDLGEKGFDIYFGHGRINARKAVERSPQTHDVLVSKLQAPELAKVNDTVSVVAEVLNFGTSTETIVTVDVLENGSLIYSTNVTNLISGTYGTFNFSWIPTQKTRYNLTCYAHPVPNETITENNVIQAYVNTIIPKTIRVPQQYQKIQEAIDAADPYDTVEVAAGIYYEHLLVMKTLTLKAENRSSIIDGSLNGTIIRTGTLGVENDVVVTGFTLQNSGGRFPPYPAIQVAGEDAHCIIENNLIISHGVGIFLRNCFNNKVINNTVLYGWYGISLFEATNNIICNNTVRYYMHGLNLFSTSDNIITENTFSNNTYGTYHTHSNYNLIYRNNIVQNVYGQALIYDASTERWDNGGEGNYWSDYKGADLYSGPYQNETGSDGIGDTHYIIDATNRDRYPLKKAYPWPAHDIAVTGIRSSKTVVGEGYNTTVTIHVTTFNYGIQTETFNLTLQTPTTIQQQTVIVTNRNYATTTFTCNITASVKGNYNLSAYASLVLNENDTSDNSFYSWITITLRGDVTGDRKVDGKDIALVAKCFGSIVGQPNYISNADVNCDGKIDGKDIGIAAKNFGQRDP